MFPHITGVKRMTYTSNGSYTADCQVSLWKKFASSFILWTRGQQIFEKPSSHLKVSEADWHEANFIILVL